MWFKQLSFFILPKDKLPSNEVLSAALSRAAFMPPEGLTPASEGFVPPASFADDWIYPVNHSVRCMLRRQEKILPAQVVREALNDKVDEIETAEGRLLSRREKQDLKEEISDTLLLQAFSKNNYTDFILERNNGFLLINQASKDRAENAVSRLRDALTSLEAKRPDTKQSPQSLMTAWLLQKEADGGFMLGEDCVLKSTDENAATARFSRQDLTTEEVNNHVKKGLVVTELGLIWRDKISFVLTQDFSFKRLRFLDLLQEDASAAGDDEASLSAAIQLLMADELAAMLAEFIECLGGLNF